MYKSLPQRPWRKELSLLTDVTFVPNSINSRFDWHTALIDAIETQGLVQMQLWLILGLTGGAMLICVQDDSILAVSLSFQFSRARRARWFTPCPAEELYSKQAYPRRCCRDRLKIYERTLGLNKNQWKDFRMRGMMENVKALSVSRSPTQNPSAIL